MNQPMRQLPDLGWMLQPMTRIPGVRHAVVSSEDGLCLGHRSCEEPAVEPLRVEEAESLAATSSGLAATGRSAAMLLLNDETVRQMMVESETGFVLVTDAGVGALLVVATDQRADVGLVAQQMQVLIAQIGHHLSSLPRDAAVS
ncbi:roadblock/LC7 domain-containing protein [Streptomyces sp. NPDC059740]|uniref:roadblock/LC7 domain-containing protein n=1 Tax=Streptomyces sp. NPDC059740 TaxID=3346926 RepID=UPI003646E2F6